MLDSFTRHVSTITLAAVTIIFALGVVWQVIHQHDVDALLAGLAGTTVGAILPSPAQTGRVTVENDPSDPVPVSSAKRGRDAGHGLVELLAGILIAALILVVVLAIVDHIH